MLVTNLTHANGNDYLSQRFSKAYAFLAQDGLDAWPAVGQVWQLVPDAAQMHVDAAIEALKGTTQALLGQQGLADHLSGVLNQ